jgi:hypothetical protein
MLPCMACIFFLSHYISVIGVFFFILVTLHLCLLLIYRYLWNFQKWQILISVNRELDGGSEKESEGQTQLQYV